MGRPDLVRLNVALVLGGSVLASSCGNPTAPLSDDPCSPDYVNIFENYPGGVRPVVDGEGVIGPTGGAVEIADPNGLLPVGLKVSVPPGAWGECWEVGIRRVTGSLTPDFPDGFVNFEDDFFFGAPSVEISIYRWTPEFDTYDAPDSLPVEISFPVQNLARTATELFSVFFYDAAGSSWRVKFPDSRDASTLTVHSDDWKRQWSWGSVDIAEIDFERYVEPALGDWIGADTWIEVKASVETVRAQAEAAAAGTISCTGLNLAAASVAILRDAFRAQVLVVQDQFNGNGANGCRMCDATTGAFVEELGDFVRLKFASFAVDMLSENAEGWAAKIATFALGVYLEGAMESLACDYECLIQRAPPEFYVYTASYWTAHLAVQAIQLYGDIIGCPAPPGARTSVGLAANGAPSCTLPASAQVDLPE